MKWFFPLCLLVSPGLSLEASEENSLASVIAARKAELRATASPEKLAAYGRGIEAVQKAQVVANALGKGDKAPDFTLPDATGHELRLQQELEKGPVVLTWYRGGWCPYCNIQLAAYQKILPQIEELGAQLIAVSPEIPDQSLSTKEKNELQFTVLSDQNLRVAAKYGLVFQLTPEVEKLYAEFFDIKEYNGEEAATNELPLAATYVIDSNGSIVWSFLDADYTKRAEPQDIIDALDSLE